MAVDNIQTPDTHFEVQQSAEQIEKQFVALIKSKLQLQHWYSDEVLKPLKARQVQANVFIVGTDRVISTFYNEKWESLLGLISLRKEYYFKQAWYLAGYKEVPSETGPVNLYRIQDIDNQGNPLPEAKPVDKFSKEYYQAFMDIDFYDDKLILETFKKPTAEDNPTVERKFSTMDDELLLSLSKSVMRIKDLVQLKKQKQITDKGYQSALVILRQRLLDTIGDYRFERINQPVTKEELDSYLSDNPNESPIDKELHTRAIRKLEQVEKAKQLKDEGYSEVTNNTKEQVAGLLEENQGVV